MMNVTDFEHRRNKILEAVIETYVSTATPVGSEVIARKMRSMLSSATIRHVMVELEEAGYLEQPHTSAGRVPTDHGYRFYVDSVMESPRMSLEQMRQLEAALGGEDMEGEYLLDRACSVLSELAQQAAFVVVPTVKQSRVKQIELVPMSVRKILCVLIANEEMIASHVVAIGEPMNREEIVALTRFINTELVGLPFEDLLTSLERRMLAESDSFYHLIKRSLDILQHALSTEPNQRLFLDGASYMVSQPEFSRDPRTALQVLRGLDDEDLFLEHVRQDIAADGLRVRIGHEVHIPGLEGCAYMVAPFSSGHVLGGVGLIGPTRLNYPRMRALVDGMGRCLTDLFSRGNAAS